MLQAESEKATRDDQESYPAPTKKRIIIHSLNKPPEAEVFQKSEIFFEKIFEPTEREAKSTREVRWGKREMNRKW